MKRIGIIDNLRDIPSFIGSQFETVTAAQCMAATGGNTGNMIFAHAVRKILGNPMTRVGWDWIPSKVRKRADHLVICCANQLGVHVDLGDWADRLEKFELPVTLIGLGAQSDSLQIAPKIPTGTQRFLARVQALKGEADNNIAVRGNFTKDILAELNVPSLAIGCPSLHISPEPMLGQTIIRGQALRSTERVAVLAGNPWHDPSAGLERVLVDIVNTYRSEYVLQHPEPMLQFAFGEMDSITPQDKARMQDVYGSSFSFDELLEWYRRNASVYLNPSSWLRSMRRFDLALGPRYHGVALAVQAGRPGCVITIDSRTEELCLGTALKHISLDKAHCLDAEGLVRYALWTEDDAVRFDTARHAKAAAYCDFLQANSLEPSAHLRRLAKMVQR